jgi:hypothetical protein
MQEISDDGGGMDQPIFENGEYAIFETGDGYVMRKFGEGDVKQIPADVSEEFWDALREQGWTDAI